MAHVGIDSRLTHYRVGGISRYIQEIIAALPAPSHQTTTIFQSRKAEHFFSDRFATAKLWTPPHHPLERIALSAELLPYRLDLYHSPDFIAPIRGAKRHVITVHDLSFVHYPEYLTAASRRYYNGQIEASVRRADHILANSHATKQDFIDVLDVPPEKITVHWLGVDDSFRPLARNSTLSTVNALNLPAEYFLFVGTIEPRKNLPGLARAYRDLLLELPDAPQLVMAGRPGWHYRQVMSDIADVGIQERLIFIDDVIDDQLPALYNHAIALLMPSFYEGFGLPALEAMACGTVPLVSDIPALREITGGVGSLVDPHDTASIADALLKALCDSSWRQAQTEAGIRRAAQFSWRKAAGIVQACYQALLN